MNKPEIVVGVVHPRGAAGTRTAGEDRWTLKFSLQPWKRDGEATQPDALSIQKSVSHADLRQLMSVIKGNQVVRLRVLVGESNKAMLLDIVDLDYGDADLNQAASKSQQPETRSDPTFGVLTLNRLIDWWEADISWEDGTIRLNVAPDDQGNPDGA